jgi:glycosyltransferase involved in cell wall biosynthesis
LNCLRILQINTQDYPGGAEKVAWDLMQTYAARGQSAWLVVGWKRSVSQSVFLLPNDRYRDDKARFWLSVSKLLSPAAKHLRIVQEFQSWLGLVGQPARRNSIRLGVEDFNFPATRHIFELASQRPDIVHCHNLHGGYFDLTELPGLSAQVPLILTLHDAWLLSGHCAHSFTCERWRTGCGQCPDLTIYPAIRQDATEYNWQRKRDIYKRSRLYVATPSEWLMNKVQQSILMEGVAQGRVIPYGIDLSVFHPAEKRAARAALNIPHDVKVLLFSANVIRQNIWKDYATLRAAILRVAEKLPEEHILFVGLGDSAPSERIHQTELRFVAHQRDLRTVARYYQAADIYLHAARADTFPNTVLEALACGTPVVATAVGGIPEQIRHAGTGFLTPPADPPAMALAIERLLVDNGLRERMGRQAAEHARTHFDLERHANDYLNWYRDIIDRSQQHQT